MYVLVIFFLKFKVFFFLKGILLYMFLELVEEKLYDYIVDLW